MNRRVERRSDRHGGALRGIFRREGEYWTIDYGGTLCRLRDSVGLRHIAYLLGRPGQPVPATELVRAGCRDRRTDGALAVPATRKDGNARVAATRPIRSAIQRIAAHNPLLFEHLSAAIRTGASCSYAPDPRLSVRWDLAKRSSNRDDADSEESS